MNPVICNLPGQSRMLEVVRELLCKANHVSIAVSFLRYSGLGLLSDDLKAYFARGGTCQVLTSTYLGITQPEALAALLQFPALECRLHIAGGIRLVPEVPVTGFHSKLYVFSGDAPQCLVGSSNMTKGGLASNIESNLQSGELQAIAQALKVFSELWNRNDTLPLTQPLIAAYGEALSRVPRNLETIVKSVPFRSDYPMDIPGEIAGECVLNDIEPNAAQLEAMARLQELRLAGERRAVVIAATGVGKTYLAAFDARQCGANSVLFVSHRLEHLTQAERTFQQVFGQKFRYGKLYQGHRGADADVVFATVVSANGSETILERNFDYVVVDEFHHADAGSYRQLLSAINPTFLLGLTATPERQDGHDVLELCDWNVAYEVRLIEAINRGWLLPFHYFGISDATVDYSHIPWRSGRFDPEELENALMLEERVSEVLLHADEKGFDGPKRATVGFCAGVRHARFMAEALNKRGIDAVAVTGEDAVEHREVIYGRFADPADPLEWLFVADVLNEGVDIPAINSLLFLRPTESATVFLQQLGRGLRFAPECEVLTVLDFVGHHRSAWLAVEALCDKDAQTNASTVAALGITPPRNCEILLDDQTLAILEKVKRHTTSRREECLKAYATLKQIVARPMPLDLWGLDDVPDVSVFRSVFGSWIDLRIASDDAEHWEHSLPKGGVLYQFLAAIERDWQQSRVFAYALLWGMCSHPNSPPDAGYEEFWQRFPRWGVEYKPLTQTKVWETLRKKLPVGLDGQRLAPEIVTTLPRHSLLAEVEGRIRLVLEKDYKTRHGGILRTPADLVLHRRYARPEIINHFGTQYDPASHNFGVIEFGCHTVIITKLDTTGAKQDFQYANKLLSGSEVQWQSQNQQRQDTGSGQRILAHRREGRFVHLFVQAQSHEKAAYFGEVDFRSVEGNAPMTVIFQLRHELPQQMFDEFNGTRKSDKITTGE